MTDTTKPPKRKAKSKAGMLDNNGRVKNPIVKPEDRVPGYKVGRPTLYKPEYCAQVITLGKQGDSKAQMAAHFDVAISTLDEWAEANPEFHNAITRARVHAQAWWEQAGRNYMVMPQGGGTFNAAVWTKSVSCRFPESYTDRSKTEVTGKDGEAIKQSIEVTFK